MHDRLCVCTVEVLQNCFGIAGHCTQVLGYSSFARAKCQPILSYHRVTADGKAKVKRAMALEPDELSAIHETLSGEDSMTMNQRLFMAVALECHARGVSEHHNLRIDDFELKTHHQFGQYLHFNMGSVLKNYRGKLNDGNPVGVGGSNYG